jgi:hypothetical protein
MKKFQLYIIMFPIAVFLALEEYLERGAMLMKRSKSAGKMDIEIFPSERDWELFNILLGRSSTKVKEPGEGLPSTTVCGEPQSTFEPDLDAHAAHRREIQDWLLGRRNQARRDGTVFNPNVEPNFDEDTWVGSDSEYDDLLDTADRIGFGRNNVRVRWLRRFRPKPPEGVEPNPLPPGAPVENWADFTPAEMVGYTLGVFISTLIAGGILILIVELIKYHDAIGSGEEHERRKKRVAEYNKKRLEDGLPPFDPNKPKTYDEAKMESMEKFSKRSNINKPYMGTTGGLSSEEVIKRFTLLPFLFHSVYLDLWAFVRRVRAKFKA